MGGARGHPTKNISTKSGINMGRTAPRTDNRDGEQGSCRSRRHQEKQDPCMSQPLECGGVSEGETISSGGVASSSSDILEGGEPPKRGEQKKIGERGEGKDQSHVKKHFLGRINNSKN